MNPPHQRRPASLLDQALQALHREAEGGTVATGRYRLHYRSLGAGPALVFVHGLADSLDSFALPFYLLSRDFRCIAYNKPTGRGDGARLRRYRHEDLVLDLYALLDHLRIDETAVLGHSFGSTVAMRALAEQPDRITRGIFANGFAYRPLANRERWLAWIMRYWPGTMGGLPRRRMALARVHCPPFAHAPRDQWEFFLEQTGRAPVRAVGHWALEVHRLDLRPMLRSIRQPVLLLCGDFDTLVPHRCQEELFQLLPGAVMFQIANAGHFPMFSHPEAMAQAVRQFLHAAECRRNVVACSLRTAALAQRPEPAGAP